MKKQVALAVAAALSLSVAGTALAAPANPFVDVPANHWAYDALAQLQKDGVVSGYGDGTFRGDRNLTRYEMAAMIAKITMPVDDKNGPLIKRLQSEFATELYNLGVRVDKLEQGASTIKFTGDARIRYQRTRDTAPSSGLSPSRWQERVRVNMTANVNDNINFYGRIVGVNDTNNRAMRSGVDSEVSTTRPLYFDRAEFAWKNGSVGVSVGRMLPKVGQGIMGWNDRADGVLVSYDTDKFTLIGGMLDNSGTTNDPGSTSSINSEHINMGVAHLGFKVSQNIGLTATWASAKGEANPYQPWAVGGNAKFGDWNLMGEYIQNTSDVYQKKGAFARLTYGAAKMSQPGSFEAYAEYVRFGQNSGAGVLNFSRFDQSVSNSKGWGLGLTYVLGKNHNLQMFYHDLKTFDGVHKYNKQGTIATNFNF